MATILESVQGTTIPQAAAVFDETGSKWTLTNGFVFHDGFRNTSSGQINLLLYYNHLVYIKSSQGNWWVWVNGWSGSKDPRIPAPTLAPAATLPIGMTTVQLYMDGKLVNTGRLVRK